MSSTTTIDEYRTLMQGIKVGLKVVAKTYNLKANNSVA